MDVHRRALFQIHFCVVLWGFTAILRSEEHTSELQSQFHLVCRLLLEKKKKKKNKKKIKKKKKQKKNKNKIKNKQNNNQTVLTKKYPKDAYKKPIRMSLVYNHMKN